MSTVENHFDAPQGTQIVDQGWHEQGSTCAEQQLAGGRCAAGVREAVDLAQSRQAALQASVLRRHIESNQFVANQTKPNQHCDMACRARSLRFHSCCR